MKNIVTRLREISGFGWQCGQPLKDKGTYLRCMCGCSQPSDKTKDGMTITAPKILREAADEIERLRAQRDEARERAASFMGMLEVMADATGSKPLRWSPSAWAMATKYAEFCGWDCFNKGKP